MRRSVASPLHDHAFEPGEFFIRNACCSLFKVVQKLSTLWFDLSFSDIEISFLHEFTSAHILAVVFSGVVGSGL